MASKYIYNYVLYVPEALRVDATAVAEALGNPDGISLTAGWLRFPREQDAEGSLIYPQDAEYWLASFPATETVSELTYPHPSREGLDGTLSLNEQFSDILWWRCDRNNILQETNSVVGTVGNLFNIKTAIDSFAV